MKISWIKYINDNKNFIFPKKLGMPVYELEDVEKIDEKISELYNKNYTTIIISSEVASFSQDIISKYKNKKNINIIITPNKKY